MPKRSIKEAAMKGASVFDTIARGQDALDTQDTQDIPTAQNVKDVQIVRSAKNTQDVRNTQKVLDKPQLERLNLKIPADLKAYLQAAAYRESSPTHTVSLTEYLCNLVRADMEKHAGE